MRRRAQYAHAVHPAGLGALPPRIRGCGVYAGYSRVIAPARTLYTTALELLNTELQQSFDPCAATITDLNREYGASIADSAPASTPLWYDLLRGLGCIADAATLTTVIGEAKAVLAGSEPWDTRLRQALDIIGQVQPPPPKTIATAIADQRLRVYDLHAVLLSQPIFAGAAMDAAGWAGNRFAGTFEMLGPSITVGEHDLTPMRLEARSNEEIMAVHASQGMRHYQPPAVYGFCLPPNPVLEALRLRAELNLYKLRTCRNITGVQRQVEPYAAPTDIISGLPQIGAGGQLVLPGTVTLQPTPYRFSVLIERAIQLAQLAAEFEAALLAALERRDAEHFNLLKARQEVELAKQGVRLQELRVNEAEDGVSLAELRQERAQIQVDILQQWVDAGLNEYELAMIGAYYQSVEYELWRPSLILE